MDRPSYHDELLLRCRAHDIRLVVSVNDLELPGLAEQAARFRKEANTILLVSSPQTVALCRDKWASYRFLREAGIAVPKTYLGIVEARNAIAAGDVSFPLLLKPRWGTSSIGIERIDNLRELELIHEWGKLQLNRTILAKLGAADPESSFVFQEFVEGHEYGIDVVNDLERRYAATLGRRKLAMRFGNTDRAVTVHDPRLEAVGRTLGERLRHVGVMDCDLMATSRGFLVLDLNPRLGGGYGFSHLAGADVPAALVAWVSGEPVEPSWFRPRAGVVSSKFDDLLVVSERTS
jgi:carbamoyl-phosphate synthase large subunit